MRSWFEVFQFGTFLSATHSEFMCIFALMTSSGLYYSLCMFVTLLFFFYLFSVSIMFYLIQYFAPKLFFFFTLRLLVCLSAFFPYFKLEFSFIVLESPVSSGILTDYNNAVMEVPMV